MDVWIIPYNVIKDEDNGYPSYHAKDHDQDESDPESDIEDECDEKQPNKFRRAFFSKIFQHTNKIYNRTESNCFYKLHIHRKLKLNKQKGIIDNFESFTMNRDPNSYLKVLEEFLSQKLCKLKAYKRYILIIDRRKGNKHINVYFYEAPKHCNSISSIFGNYFRYNQFFNSHKCVLPKDPTLFICDKPKDIGLYDTENGYMFGLSYHINHKRSISSYWASHGTALRFLPHDMINIWPHYFVHNHVDTNIINNTQFNTFKDKPFEEFYKVTTGRNDLYLNRNQIINNDNNESGSDEDRKYEQKSNMINHGEIENERDMVINKIMSLNGSWSQCVCLSVQSIQDRFEDECDVTDIIDDINEGIDESELLYYLINKGGVTESDAIQFGQQVIYLLGEGH